MSKKLTKEEALHFITTWRDSLDEPRVEDGDTAVRFITLTIPQRETEK